MFAKMTVTCQALSRMTAKETNSCHHRGFFFFLNIVHFWRSLDIFKNNSRIMCIAKLLFRKGVPTHT